MRYDPIQTSFLSGEISPQLLGRTDLEGYKAGAKTVENMIIKPHGGANRRGGFRYVREVKDSSKDTILVELAYRDEFFYILEFGDLYFRIYRNQARVGGGSPIEVVTPYTEAQLRELRFTQDEGNLYIVHKDHLPSVIHRLSHTDWDIHELAEGGVDTVDTFVDQGDHTNGTYQEVALTAGGGSGAKGDITVAGGAITDIHIHSAGSGYAVDNTLTIDNAVIGGSNPIRCDVATLAMSNPPSTWAAGEYPSLIWFFEQRLWMAASPEYPNSIWSSKSAEYFDFDLGTGLTNESIQIIVKDATKFLWAVSGKQVLLGAHNGEFILAASSEGDALTPANVRPVPTTKYGSAFKVPIQIDTNTVFLQRGARKFRRTEYKLASDKYTAKDITILSEHITKSGITDLAYANEPDSYIWSSRTDGELVGLTYEPDYEVFAWHRHVIGGVDALVKSIAVSDGVTVDQDELWAINERTIDGNTVKYVEFMIEGLSSEAAQENAFFMDSGVTKSGVFTTFDGLDHLEGEEVQILVDGAVQAPKTVSGGSITLDTASASKGHAGLGYDSYLDPIMPEGGNPIGSSEGKIGRILTIALRLVRSLGFEIGIIGGIFDIYYFGPPENMDEAIPVFTGDTEPIPYPGDSSRNIGIRIRQTDPLPLNVLAILYEASTK